MRPDKLLPGDTIGIVSPCGLANRERYAAFIDGIRALGYNVKEGANLYKNTYGYGASEHERADDFNAMICDPAVKMILFGGGDLGNELLPLIDYDAVRHHPKIICSYSNGTSILNAVYARTGLVTYYGQMPGLFADLSAYNRAQFEQHFVAGEAGEFASNSEWKALTGGICEGMLLGGYTTRFIMLQAGPYFGFDSSRKYVLFLENCDIFHCPASAAAHLAYIEQSALMRNVTGLLFGHYSDKPYPELDGALRRFGERNHIPVVACDDFGHGINHAILPIGGYARLDADRLSMRFVEN